MVRSFVFMLILLIVFLCGIVVGIERETKDDLSASPISEQVQVEEKQEITEADENASKNPVWQMEELKDVDESPLFVEKVAGILETVVTTFYEIIVELLYQIAKIFF